MGSCSALDDVHRQAAARGFLVLVLHVAAGVAHGPDDLVEADLVLAVAAEGHARGVDGLDRAHGVALDAGDLDQPADGVAGQAQVVFHADLGGVLDLGRGAAQGGGEAGGGHRAGHAHLALAADLGAGNRGVFLVEDADRGGGEQEVEHALLIGARAEAVVVVQHRGDDAGRAVGGGGDDPATGGVLFVDRERVEVDPVERGQRVAQRGLGAGGQFGMHRGCAPADVEPAWQGATVADAALHARLHRRPQLAQAVADPVGAAPALLVLEHHLRDALAGLPRACQQFVAAGERVRYRGGIGDDPVLGRLVLVDHEAAADGVVVAAGDLVAFGVVRGEAHAVGVVGQLLPLVHQQVALFLERDFMPAGQADAALAADALHGGGDDVGIDHVRHVAFQAHHDRLVGAMAATGEGQRAEDFGAYAGDVLQAPGLDQPAVDEAGGGAHGPDGVGGARPDADLVEVEGADGHAAILSGPHADTRPSDAPVRSSTEPIPAR